jgi:hypothetical protein
MKTYEDGLSKSLCAEIRSWVGSYIFHRENDHPEGFPQPVVTFTNYAWPEYIVRNSAAVIIYMLPETMTKVLRDELILLNIIEKNESITPMVYAWTPGSYIPIHKDGAAHKDRKVVTAYLNDEWSEDMGGLFNYQSKATGKTEVLTPHEGFLVYNDEDEVHFTTPVKPGYLRLSLQIFAGK